MGTCRRDEFTADRRAHRSTDLHSCVALYEFTAAGQQGVRIARADRCRALIGPADTQSRDGGEHDVDRHVIGADDTNEFVADVHDGPAQGRVTEVDANLAATPSVIEHCVAERPRCHYQLSDHRFGVFLPGASVCSQPSDCAFSVIHQITHRQPIRLSEYS